MYRRHAILNPRKKFESNMAENDVYGTNTCSSISFLNITMMAKHVITHLKENRRNEPLKRIKSVIMSLLIEINNYAYSSTIYTPKSTQLQGSIY